MSDQDTARAEAERVLMLWDQQRAFGIPDGRKEVRSMDLANVFRNWLTATHSSDEQRAPELRSDGSIRIEIEKGIVYPAGTQEFDENDWPTGFAVFWPKSDEQRAAQPAEARVCEWCDDPAIGSAFWQGSDIRRPSCGEHGFDFKTERSAPTPEDLVDVIDPESGTKHYGMEVVAAQLSIADRDRILRVVRHWVDVEVMYDDRDSERLVDALIAAGWHR